MSNMSFLTASKIMIKRFFWPVNKDIYLGRVYKMVCCISINVHLQDTTFTGLYLGPLFLIIHRLLFSTDRQIIFYRQCHCILCLSTLLFSELSDIHLFSCLTLFKQTGQEGVPQQAMEYSRGRLHQAWTNGCSKGIT
ncbi:hypothetical protein PHYBLDRAFT_176454 [Phycomyces blakesleeanus NRRL 1555(-)]|uniref:Uncharacterized protein n=1 Tax=Phycomyces blakesleeanus (strain ATCC 8743b / DSM 1359 / FGSC 10004 / NBRC 33097 / NRRL 1555) TaxID=763407 RepID=A0A162W739_PHYB8|nr:hypothetical protein PHYBLDRAFT_176454 [Phycomyces blakesleeanus NRRL 1555(-)]OAD65065.1 hypothetical protein PHYBLDRAFT_176454 [Phycomyces blakesleeanus NRRL 1555(-)]|eukprot:XP_018283105.1 hypothetical protein PHYBLDRAFT_176454 [Phycomyces blakesleeanus NRRL 1555(-)]